MQNPILEEIDFIKDCLESKIEELRHPLEESKELAILEKKIDELRAFLHDAVEMAV